MRIQSCSIRQTKIQSLKITLNFRRIMKKKETENPQYFTPTKNLKDVSLGKSMVKFRQGYMFTNKSHQPISFHKLSQQVKRFNAKIQIIKNQDNCLQSRSSLKAEGQNYFDRRIDDTVLRCEKKRNELKSKLDTSQLMIKNLISMRRHREAIWKMDKENHESLLRSIGWKSEMSNLIIEEQLQNCNIVEIINKNRMKLEKKIYILTTLKSRLEKQLSVISHQYECFQKTQWKYDTLKKRKDRNQKHLIKRDIKKKEMEEIKLEFEAIRYIFYEEEFDYFILNIESRPEIKIGFRTFCEGISKELMFNGEKWNKEKGINLTERNIKIYLKLQLYPRFEKLLKNFSLSRQQLKIIVGEQRSEKISNKIRQYLIKIKEEKRSQPPQKSIIYCCEFDDKRQVFRQKMKECFQNFDNDLVKVKNIEFHKNKKGFEQLAITCNYLENEDETKYFKLFLMKTITKEQVLRILRQEKPIIFLIDIPIFCSPQQRKNYTEVYDTLKKRVV